MSRAMLAGVAAMVFGTPLIQGAAAEENKRGEATILLTDDSEMRQLNRRYRSKDSSTNVLSFAAAPLPGAEGSSPLGDIVLAAETVQREAEAQGIASADHAAHLVVHGMLHLLGFGHEEDAEADRMEAMEVEILAGLGIADPYAERARPQRAEV